MLNIALPKGRLGNDVYALFSQIGCECHELLEENRKLVFENHDTGIRYLLVKPSDVATYVERGAADMGVVGRDVLLETGADIYELLDLHMGICKLAVAAKNGFSDDTRLPLRVATKYPNITKEYFSKKNRAIEIIKLNGSIELAPILGLSDVIVDIVETGKTLEENDLTVYTDITSSSARLIANKSSYRFETARMDTIVKNLRKLVITDDSAL